MDMRLQASRAAFRVALEDFLRCSLSQLPLVHRGALIVRLGASHHKHPFPLPHNAQTVLQDVSFLQVEGQSFFLPSVDQLNHRARAVLLGLPQSYKLTSVIFVILGRLNRSASSVRLVASAL